MSQTRFRQLGIAVALTAALGLAGAQPGDARSPVHSAPRHVLPQPGVFERVWEWLAGTRSLSNIWPDAGPGLDPDGARTTGSPGSLRRPTDMGPGLDPNGGKTTSAPPAPVRPTTDMGPGIDPDGHS
jgi:hypothetical protein